LNLGFAVRAVLDLLHQAPADLDELAELAGQARGGLEHRLERRGVECHDRQIPQ
jgi:hypothetical protein